MASFEDQLDVILRHEGGFQKWPSDRGNYLNGRLIGTKYGIVPYALARHRGVKHITEAQMRALTLSEAKDIYRVQYYQRAKIRLLPNQIEYKVFDMCVNHGVHGGVKLLQRSIARFGYKIAQDGKIGPQTVKLAYACIKKYGPRAMVNKMVQVRNAYYAAIIRSRPSQEVFRKGWLRRSNSFTNTAAIAFKPGLDETQIAENDTVVRDDLPPAIHDNDVENIDDLTTIEQVAEAIIGWVENLLWRPKQA